MQYRRLALFHPVKPLRVNQAHGIFNPAYKQFGFTEHNGVDYATEDGQIAYAMCEGIVTDVGYNKGAGNYVRYKTEVPVDAENQIGVVEFMYMHADHALVERGQYVKVGTPLIVCDNTGFSTGRHLHISAYFIGANGLKKRLGRSETDWCFDFSKYYNGMFAGDAYTILGILQRIVALLKKQKGL